MIGFEYYNPAKIVFGEGSENNLGKLLEQYRVTSLLLVYSGDFIKTLGIYDVITNAVNELGIKFSESGEVVPNPSIELVRKLVKQGKELAPEQLVAALPDVDVAVINGNYAIEGGLHVSQALAVEANDGLAAKTYGNIIATSKAKENDEKSNVDSKADNKDKLQKYYPDKSIKDKIISECEVSNQCRQKSYEANNYLTDFKLKRADFCVDVFCYLLFYHV